MTKEFIKKLAESRADCIFQPEYYKHVTDSWYLDEKFGFENAGTRKDFYTNPADNAVIYWLR